MRTEEQKRKHREYQKHYRERNSEKTIARHALYRAENKEAINARKRAHYHHRKEENQLLKKKATQQNKDAAFARHYSASVAHLLGEEE